MNLKSSLIVMFGVSILAFFFVSEWHTRQSSAPLQPEVAAALVKAKVTLTNDGYGPALVTVKVGQAVEWTNQSDRTMWVASDPHPTHGGLPRFDEYRFVRRGGVWRYKFYRTGRFGYHDHTNPSLRGTVVVEPAK